MIQERVDALASFTVDHPKKVVAVFGLLTLILLPGLANITTETGTDQFTEATPAYEAFESVQAEFGTPFQPASSSTTLIHTSQNALSKKSLLNLLQLEKQIWESSLRVSSISTPADTIAQSLNPNATTYQQKIHAIETATPSEIEDAVQRLSSNPAFSGTVSKDFNAESGYASAVLGSVSHPFSDSDTLTSTQNRIDRFSSDTIVFGQGIVSSESQSVIFDSLVIVVPAASVLIVFFLIYAYRDPLDLGLGILCLVLAILWTFGFMGLAGIAFSQMLIAVPPLLLAVGIDFGIHAVNRYKEERIDHGVEDSMEVALRQLLVAFFMVAGTTVIGFLSNLTSTLPPIQDFGLVAGIGIIFTTLIFGIFLPASKLLLDQWRRALGIQIYGSTPVGSEESLLGKLLPLGAVMARAPYLMVGLTLLIAGFSGFYGMGVSTSFSQEDFLPPENVPQTIQSLPEPFKPGEYTATGTLNLIDRKFTSAGDQVILYIDAPARNPAVLEEIQRRSRNVPDSFATENGQPQYQSIVQIMQSYSQRNPEFGQLYSRSDTDGDGLPEKNMKKIYTTLLDSSTGAEQFVSSDLRSLKLSYTVESSASQAEITSDARDFAGDFRTDTTATGQTVIFKGISDIIFSSAIVSLAISLTVSSVFLIILYQVVFGKPLLAVANLFPVVVTLSLIIGTMRALGVPLNALTATILSITIGLGVDYSVHATHRFEDELKNDLEAFEALKVTLRGTGGALTGSMFTTVTGIGVLVLAITPVLGQFGLITGISIFYSYLSSILVLPSALVIWQRWRG